MCKRPQCKGSANARPPSSHSLYILFNCMDIITPLSLVRLSGVNVLQESKSEGDGEEERSQSQGDKFKTVPMTPGGCWAGVSPVGTEQVNTEPWLVLVMLLSSCSVCGTFCSASCRRRPGRQAEAEIFPSWRQDTPGNFLQGLSLAGIGRLPGIWAVRRGSQ